MSKVSRALRAARATLKDPQERRAYKARVKWLLRGSNTLEAHSIEYRYGLSGKWKINAQRLATENEISISCPTDCAAHAPLTHVYEARATYELHDTVTSTVSGATVMTHTSVSDFFVRESITWPFESIVTHGLEVPDVAAATFKIDYPTIVFPTTNNYYHWLIEDLPSVLRALEVRPQANLVSFSEAMTQRNEIVAKTCSKDILKAPALVSLETHIMAGRADGNWFAHPEDLRRLRQLGADIAGESQYPGKHVYVSRRLSQRPLPNEDELEKLMVDSGYDVVYLEQLPWEAQIALFRQAAVVVGPHGAGLANLAFSAPGTTLVELTSGAMYNRCYEWLCHAGQYRYASVQIDGDLAVNSPSGFMTPSEILHQVTRQVTA